MMRNKYLGVMIATVIALGALAYAQPDKVKVGKTGHITLAQETMVGSTVLPSGDYEVRHRRSPGGHFVEFTRVTENIPSGEGISPYDWEVVAEVPCTMESLNAPVTRTEAEISRGSVAHLDSLRIREENVIHIFRSGLDASAPQNQIEYGGG
jgi:hypothetical protein